MGFLEDLGRTRALSTATEDLVNVAIKKDELDVVKRKAALEQKAYDEGEKEIAFTLYTDKLEPRIGKRATELGLASGLVYQNSLGQTVFKAKHGQSVAQVYNNTMTNRELLVMQTQIANEKKQGLLEEYNKALSAGNAEKAQKAAAEIDKTNIELGSYGDHASQMDKQKEALLKEYPAEVVAEWERFGDASIFKGKKIVTAAEQLKELELTGKQNILSGTATPEEQGLFGETGKVQTDALTITNISTGETQRVYPEKGQAYTPPKGWKIGTMSKGMKVTTNADGTVSIEMGGDDVTVKTKSDIEKKIIDGTEAFNRIKTISDTYKPEYQEIGNRLAMTWTGIQSKFGQPVKKEDANKLAEWKKHQRKSIENINLYIKELTGAQMSELEADRLRLAQPDPGEKWWQGDNPITYKAKIDDILKYSRASIARFEYYKNQGISPNKIKEMIDAGKVISLDDLVKGMK